MTGHHEFLDGEIIKFDRIITTIGEGYVQSNGKFIATVSGTYQFSGTFYDRNHKIGVELMKNVERIIFANNRGSGTASFSAIWWREMRCTWRDLSGWTVELDTLPPQVSLVFCSTLTSNKL